MNFKKVICFDFDGFNLESFRSLIKPLVLECQVVGRGGLFVYLFSVSGKRIGPVLYFNNLNGDYDHNINKLYLNINFNISFLDTVLTSYVDSLGVRFNRAFFICFSNTWVDDISLISNIIPSNVNINNY